MSGQAGVRMGAREYGPYDRLGPLERDPAAMTGQPAASSGGADGTTAAVEPPLPFPVDEVRYARDEVADAWVARLFDGASGRYLRTVPGPSAARGVPAEQQPTGRVDATA